jgi:hypothetical protein
LSAEPEVVIKVSADTSDAVSKTSSLSGQLVQMGESGFKAASRLTSGAAGILAAQDNLYTAQTRVNVATISYTLAVREYGQGSIQAARAQDQLNIATQGVTVANDRLTLKYVQFAITTGPAVLKAIMSMMAASEGMTLRNFLETASWTEKAAAIGATAVALSLVAIALAAATGGLSAIGGVAGAAATGSTVNQSNNFYGGGSTPQQNQLQYSNAQLSNGYRA